MADEEKPQATLRETLVASIAQHSEPAEPAEDPAAAEPVEAAAAPTETAEQKAGRLAGRARDEKGRVLPGKPIKPNSAAQEQKPVESALSSAPAAPPAPAAAEPALPPIQRPSSWEKGMWPIWDKMAAGQSLSPQEARQVAEYNSKRETQFATGVSTYKNIADSAKPLMEAIAPFQADIEKHGANAPQLIHGLLSSHRTLALGSPQQKLQLLAKVAQDYGIPIQALYDQSAQQQYLMSAPAQALQPIQQQAPQQDLDTLLEQKLAEREVKQTVASMERDSEKYPAFQYVRATMAQLLETGGATDLDDAYQKAIDAPEHAFIASVLQQQQTAANEQARVAAATATAKVARTNAVSPRSATPASTAAPDVGKKGVREALRAAMDQHLGGARV